MATGAVTLQASDSCRLVDKAFLVNKISKGITENETDLTVDSRMGLINEVWILQSEDSL